MTAGKGDTPRPIVNRGEFESNWEDIFGKSRLQKAIDKENEECFDTCLYCGFRMEDPCDELPPDTCGKALDKQFTKGDND